MLQSFTVIDWNDDDKNQLVVAAADVDPKNRSKTFEKRLELLARPEAVSKQ